MTDIKTSSTPKSSKPSKLTKASKPSKKKASLWRRIYRTTLIVLTIIASICLIAGSFSGNLSPLHYRGVSLPGMLLPAWLLAMIAIIVLDAIWCRRALIICALACAISAPTIWEFSPLNLFGPSEKSYIDCPKFSLLTYNVQNFESADSIYPNGQNPTLSYVLSSGADVVCIQECSGLRTKLKGVKISAEQIDSLNKTYPYIFLYGKSQMLFSKYPAKPLSTGSPQPKGSGEIAVFRLDVEGLPITLFNVHLQSYRLTKKDKSLYYDLTELNVNKTELKQNIKDARSQLITKILNAAEGRAADAERLTNYIRRFGGPNVIIAGDFNDVPGCYTLRQLEELEMHQVYPEVGFGPMTTFNDNRFYFRIDHILYRGKLKPLDLTRGTLRSSDHYPLQTTFAIVK